MRVAVITIILVILVIAPSILKVPAGNGPCDPDLKQSFATLGYHQRGNRCEGSYYEEKVGETIRFASLTTSFGDFDTRLGRDLIAKWKPLGNHGVYLRAQGIRPKLYYRMDTGPLSVDSFRWPTDVLDGLGIGRKDIGLLCWTLYSLRGVEQKVYLPLKISQGEPEAKAKEYRAVIVPGRELTEVYISLGVVEPDGREGALLINSRPLKHGYYPDGWGTEFTVEMPKTSGICYLEVASVARSGSNPPSTKVFFYHSSLPF